MFLTLGHAKIGESLGSVAWDLEISGKLAGRVFRSVLDFICRPIESYHCLKAYRVYLKIIGVL